MGIFRPLIFTALVVFVLDQISKAIILLWIDLDTKLSVDVLPPVLNLRMAWNDGINFGLFPGAGRWLLIAIALIISGWVIWWMRRDRPGRWAMISAGFLLGGAMGNVIDRILHGAVADFLNMSCCGIILFTGNTSPRDATEKPR
jgi:signal peptidase II